MFDCISAMEQNIAGATNEEESLWELLAKGGK